MENENPAPNENPPNEQGNQPPVNDDKGKGKGSSSKPTVDKQAEAYREQQSRADRAEAERDEVAERLEFLEGEAVERMRDKAIADFRKENGEKYPNVTDEDLVRFATGPDDLEETAKYLQEKHDKIKQDTLASARDVPDDSISQSEFDAEKKKLDESNDPDRFNKWLRLKAKRIRK